MTTAVSDPRAPAGRRERGLVLGPAVAEGIVADAREVLATIGVAVADPAARDLLLENGARLDGRARLLVPASLVDRALATVPASVALFDVRGECTHDLGGDRVSFTPGSAALFILDGATGEARRPDTADYVRYAKVVAGLPHLAAQSTALVPADVPAAISDAYRLYLSLLHCEKPVVTGAFGAEGLGLMLDQLRAVRGGGEALRRRPLAVFTCCPTAPLGWSEAAARNLVDCARAGVPVEVVAVPLAGLLAPVTLREALVQHTAEDLSGVVLSQLAAPGAPVLWGGSPAIFDVRNETTPMGAAESILLCCGAAEIGKHLGLPTQAYLGLSDAKRLDAQAGLETAFGALMAALAGINCVAGAGMLDFENCQSLEKLVLDDEACAMALRLAGGIDGEGQGALLPLFEELVREQQLVISNHTRRHRDRVLRWPGPVIDRSSAARWDEDGRPALAGRARDEVDRLEKAWTPPRLAEGTAAELERILSAAARTVGLARLPAR